MAREEAEIKELTKKLEQNPDSMVFVQLADAWRRAGNLEKCVEVCQQGLERHPTYTTARTILGRAFLDLGKLDEAAGEFKKIEVSDPENIVVQRMLGQIYMQKGQFAEAIARHQKVLALDPDDTSAQEHLQEALNKAKQSGEAIPSSKPSGAAPAAPAKAGASAEQMGTIKVAEIYIKKGAFDEAAEVLNEIIASDPGNALAQQKLRELEEIKSGRAGAAKAAEEAKQREEEAKRKAVEDAKRRAEEESRQKAEEEARRRSEEAARNKAAEEAKRKSEEEAAKKKGKLSSDDILSVMASGDDDLVGDDSPSKGGAPKAASGSLSPQATGHVSDFAQKNGIEAHLVISREGALLLSAMPASADLKALSPAASAVFANTEKAAQRMRFGALNQVIISAEDGRQVLFVSLKSGVLVALTGKSTNLGLLRIAINDLVKKA